jgi:hypothetical protein
MIALLRKCQVQLQQSRIESCEMLTPRQKAASSPPLPTLTAAVVSYRGPFSAFRRSLQSSPSSPTTGATPLRRTLQCSRRASSPTHSLTGPSWRDSAHLHCFSPFQSDDVTVRKDSGRQTMPLWGPRSSPTVSSCSPPSSPSSWSNWPRLTLAGEIAQSSSADRPAPWRLLAQRLPLSFSPLKPSDCTCELQELPEFHVSAFAKTGFA